MKVQRRLVQTLEFADIPIVDGEELRFRLEVFSETDGNFSGRLYRIETYKCAPRFTDFKQADVLLTVVEQTIPLETLLESSADAVVTTAIGLLNERFCVDAASDR